MKELTYAVVTPVRDEEANLRRLSSALAEQTRRPVQWIIVDTGSTDGTCSYVEELARDHDWIAFASLAPASSPTRAEPIVRAFEHGVAQLEHGSDLVVKLDADVSFQANHFETLAREFAAHTQLGIASGTAFERDASGTWQQRHGTGAGVWGANRVYRWECLQDVSPLEVRIGWDTIDLVRAGLRGWQTKVLLDLPFFHHRSEGARDGTSWARWAAQGRAARYMGYRFSYLLLRAGFRMRRDRAAIALVAGYLEAALRREPACDDEVQRAVRDQQRLGAIPNRLREALRHRSLIDTDA